MSAFETLRGALGDRIEGTRPDGLSARCPAHDDGTASLDVTAKGNKVLVHCHAGCNTESVVEALGLTMRDLYDGDNRPATGRGRIVAEYDYVDVGGALLFQKVRMEPKDFRCRQPNPTGHGWQWNMKGVTPVVYRLPAVRAAIAAQGRVCIVEGEKDAHTLERLGFVATCNFDGAAKDGQRPKWRAREAHPRATERRNEREHRVPV